MPALRYSTFLKFSLVAALLVTAGCQARPSKSPGGPGSWHDRRYRLERREKISMAQGVEAGQYAQFKNDLEFLKKRNPFNPVAVKAETTGPGLILEGIIQAEVPAAIINDEIVSEGDTVAGMVVKEIRESAVILLKDGEEYKIELRFE